MKMDLGIAEQTKRQRRYMIAAFALAALAALAAAAVNPIGYVGAGWDDEQYLAAARCWVAQGGPCVPTSHWWTRWPLVGPMAVLLGTLGESRFAAELAPGLWWAMALGMAGWLGTAWFNWRAGALAIALLGTAPIVAFNAFDPNIDIPELALQLSALAVATIAYRRQSRRVAIAAGVVAGLALQARETSVLFLCASALTWFALPRESRRVLLWAVAGVAGAELAEMLAYAVGTGDPFMRARLALGHTDIPTNQLATGFHSNRGPILNPDYIRAWKREMQVTVWWPIDPWLNLLASPQSGMLLASGGLAFAVLGKRLEPAERRNMLRLLCGAGLIAIGLIYVLAIDPKTRMFMSLYGAWSIAAGAVIARGLRTEAKPLAAVLAFVPILGGIYVMSQYTTSSTVETRAKQWIARYGQDIEIFHGAASYLTFVPETKALAPAGSGRRYLLTTASARCEQLIDNRPGHRKGVLIDQVYVQGALCLFEYLPVRPSVVR
jgi:hypothetical protein